MNVQRYATYNLWANRRMVDMISPLSEEQMTQEIKSSFSSVRETVLHIWYAEIIWLQRLQGKIPNPIDQFESSSALCTGLLEISEEFEQYVTGLTNPTEDYSYATTMGVPYTMSRVDTIHHCMNHSTFHRGQLITMLRQLGQTDLVSTDYITYLREAQQS